MLEKLEKYFMEKMFLPMAEKSVTHIFNSISGHVEIIQNEIAISPADWNSGAWGLVSAITDNAIMPVAYLILAYVICYELYQALMDYNAMHENSLAQNLKLCFKCGLPILLLQNAQNIMLAIFDLVSWILNKSGLTISGAIDVEQNVADIMSRLAESNWEDVFQTALIAWILSFLMGLMSVLIKVVLIGRMLEILVCISIGPIPIATMTAKGGWNIGENYIKGLASLALQGLFIMIVVSIYIGLVQSASIEGDDVSDMLWSTVGLTCVLCFSLFKTSTWAKSALNAH